MRVSSTILLLVVTLFLVYVYCDESSPYSPNSPKIDTNHDALKEAAEKSGVKHEFQAEINQLLAIIINSLYTNKEIFLRELISNASDALNKIRFIGLTEKEALASGETYEIRIQPDKERNTLTIRDTGIGMTRNDLLNNLGTIAKSGTKAFLEKLQKSSDHSLIGQFGVGFYSAFLVADQVVVVTKNNDDKQLIWTSAADNTFTVTEDPRGDTLGRGTEIILHLKDDAKIYTDDLELRNLIGKYSEFIQHPIHLYTTSVDNKEIPDEEGQAKQDEEYEAELAKWEQSRIEKGEEVDEEEKPKPKAKKTKWEQQTTNEWKWINQARPIWTRSPSDITEADYHQFYRAISREFDNPLTYSHFSAEGGVDFKALLYVPFKAPQNLFDFGKKLANVKLYVKRVFITDAMDDLLPRYLNFVRGVVDSDDLPLNVSREILQHSKLLRKIKKKLTAKIIAMLQDLANKEKEIKRLESEGERKRPKGDKEWDEARKYTKCWKEFGKNIRLGVIEDEDNRKKLINLLRYPTTLTETDEYASLDEYVDRMKPDQEQIYFLAGESMKEVLSSPFIEKLKQSELEVLLMTDAIDEYTIQHVKEHRGKTLQNIASEEFTLPGDKEEAEKNRWEAIVKNFEPLVKFLEKNLGSSKASKVQVSKRVTNTPCVLVSPKYGISANMQKIQSSQALSNDNPQLSVLNSMRIMEINPEHPIIQNINERVKVNSADTVALQSAELLFEAAMMRSGYRLEDTSQFADRIFSMQKEFLENQKPAEPSDEPEKQKAAKNAPEKLEEEVKENDLDEL
ncbi:heat-shock protein Hsp90 [Acrasis kona]|uniref:Heat-shock protein Hsp90 n=1 Tax=Acrasis kona TaxID=1008807 RepID=A0AAW2Z4K0_9EUKA